MPQYKNPLHFGLAVGIDRYPALGHLQHARADARAFHAWLTDPDGGSVPPDNCRLIVAADKEMPPEATQDQAVPIADLLHDALLLLEKLADAALEKRPDLWGEARLYYYVSGHGLAVDPRDAALLMANAGRPRLMGRHVSCARVLDYFLRLQTFHELVIFADCCRDRDAGAPWMPLPFNPIIGAQKGEVVTAVCLATLFGEKSFEPEKADGRRGFFTDALLKGLRGEFARPDEPIDSNNLAAFVRQRVRALTQTDDFTEPQTPVFQCDAARPVLFRPPLARAAEVAYRVALTFQGYTGGVQLRGGDRKPIAQQAVAPGAAWVLSLPGGLYKVEPLAAGAAPFRGNGLFEVIGEDSHVDF